MSATFAQWTAMNRETDSKRQSLLQEVASAVQALGQRPSLPELMLTPDVRSRYNCSKRSAHIVMAKAGGFKISGRWHISPKALFAYEEALGHRRAVQTQSLDARPVVTRRNAPPLQPGWIGV